MVLIALAILFAGIGALSWSRSGSDSEAASSAETETTQTTTAAATTTLTEAQIKAVNIRVYNNSDIAGLAAQMSERLTESGWNVAETGNYSDTQLPQTTVYYGDEPGEEEAAKQIAEEVGGEAEPRPASILEDASGVLVIVTGE